jgi:hypothetical protein
MAAYVGFEAVRSLWWADPITALLIAGVLRPFGEAGFMCYDLTAD